MSVLLNMVDIIKYVLVRILTPHHLTKGINRVAVILKG